LKYSTLTQTHPDYDGRLWERLRQLYVGGYEILQNAGAYIPRSVNEPEPRYQERLRNSSYVSHLGQIVDFLTSALHTQPVRVAPESIDGVIGVSPDSRFYDEFARDADLQGTPFAAAMRDATADALVYGRALVALDFPRVSVQPETRAEEEAIGAARAYAYRLPVSALLDWERDDYGSFTWAIVRRVVSRRESPNDARGLRREEFTIWERTPEDGVKWSVYSTKLFPVDRKIEASAEVAFTDSGVSSFAEIPIVEMRLPPGLRAGNKIGPLAEEHFRRRSMLHGSMSRNLVEIPYIKLGSELPGAHEAPPSEVQQDPNRAQDPIEQFIKRGFVPLGADDDIGYVGPSGTAYELTDRQLHETREEMYRSVHAMALSIANTGASLRRSGESKREDRRSLSVVLGALGVHIRHFSERIYTQISVARNERAVWTGHGLDHYDLDDTDQLLDDAKAARIMRIPSPTFERVFMTRVAQRLVPTASPEEKRRIQQEIAESRGFDFKGSDPDDEQPPAPEIDLA
jgi:hypothetical protein